MNKIQILLSTYNGDAHLREQLESFFALEGAEDISLLVRDDGSKDGTCEILREYERRKDVRVIYGENVGLNASMQILFENADPDCLYYAYADQDDVWLKDKLSRAVRTLDACDPQTPVLYAARSHLTDVNGNIIGETCLPKRSPSFENAMVQNVCIGHTQVYNRPMLALLATHFHKDIFVIDHWAYLLAAAFGEVVFDPSLVTLYRQHGKNAIGYGHTLLSKVKNRFRRARAGVPGAHTRQLLALASLDDVTWKKGAREALDRFLSAKGSLPRRFAYLLRRGAFRQGFVENLGFRILFLFGAYNENK